MGQEAIEKSTLKLIDFGLAREFAPDQAGSNESPDRILIMLQKNRCARRDVRYHEAAEADERLCLRPGVADKSWHPVLRGATGGMDLFGSLVLAL